MLFQLSWNNVPDDMEQCSGLVGTGVLLIKNPVINLIIHFKSQCYTLRWLVNLEAWK